MNTVTVATAVEPHLVTTVTNNTSMRGVVGNQVHPIISNGYSAGVPTLVTNGIIDGGRTNPTGPQLEEEDKMDRGMIGGEDNCMNLLNSSPDEHEPLLQREQPPAESTPTPHQHHHHQSRPGNIPSGRVSNSNNNNNRIALGSDVKFQGLEVDPERMIGSEVSRGGGINSAKPETQQISGSPASYPVSNLENKILLSNPAKGATSGRVQILQAPPTGQDRGPGLYTGPCVWRALVALPVLAPQSTRSPKAHLVQSTTLVPGCRDPDSGLASSSTTPASQAQEPATKTSTSSSTALDARTLTPEVQALKASDPEASVLEASVENQKVSPLVASENPAPENSALESQDPEIAVITEAPATQPAALQSPALVPQTPSVLRPQMGLAKAKRPERPCSLDLSSSCISSGEPRLNV